ncbi:hypothetical protein RCO27_16485 [Sphingosinicella sp. LHD-64]|uniref:hypothetical protein n=1 Tax=Sphingosinicella sp. LHD-64 TaxID=3072139 RepID=UPI00281057D3|nr:hypothetical protein [Sphingosinicella sp. LHD-64]MDQ8757825.1 hypothetical protein [Sphingosinicella sp. LHD-64]
MMRREFTGMLLAAAVLAAPATAQQPERPLGDLLESLPPPEAAQRSEAAPREPSPRIEENGPAIPIVRPPPFSATPPPLPPPLPPPPTVTPGHVGTMDLPPSSVTYDMPAPAADVPLTETPVVAVEAPPAPVGTDTAANAEWAALQEQRRQEINAVESPVVARLNANIAAEQEAARQRAEQAQADYEQAVVDREESIRRTEEEHQAAIAAHDAEVARRRAAYEAQVAACLDGDRQACEPR